MTKVQLKEKTLSVIEDRHERFINALTLAINNIDEKDISDFDNDYFLPKALFEAINNRVVEKVTTYSFSVEFVRKHRKYVRYFQRSFNRW